MPRYQKKPIVVDAFQMTFERRWNNSEWPQWLHEAWNKDPKEAGCVYCVDDDGMIGPGEELCITTLEGTHAIRFDDWIIRGIKGELYPCKPDIFKASYDILSINKEPETMPGMNQMDDEYGYTSHEKLEATRKKKEPIPHDAEGRPIINSIPEPESDPFDGNDRIAMQAKAERTSDNIDIVYATVELIEALEYDGYRCVGLLFEKRNVLRTLLQKKGYLSAPYGYCPHCKAPGVQRERRPNGNDKCENGHCYPASAALKELP